MDLDSLLNMFNINGLILSGGVILGVLICLFGLKFEKLVLAIVGLVVGYALGNMIVNLVGVDNYSLVLVIKFGLALVVGACSSTLFESLVSIVAGVGTFILVSDMIGTVWYSYLVAIIIGLVLAFVVAKYYKLGIIILTSCAGSYLVTKGVIDYFDYSYLVIFGVVFIVGVIFQCITNRIKF